MINILFCGNDKIFDGLLTETLSILMRTTTKTPFCFYVFTMDITRVDPKYTPISDQQIDFLDKITKKYNPQNQVDQVLNLLILYIQKNNFFLYLEFSHFIAEQLSLTA